MEYIRGTTTFCIQEPSVISLGKFDGLHRGHELLLECMFQKRKEGLRSVIFTFDIPPKKLAHHEPVKVLTTNDEKMNLFERIGIDYLIECPFTQELMCMEPYDFIKKIVSELQVRYMVVGRDFRFGHNRTGDYHILQQYAAEFGYEVAVMEKMQYEQRDISSTFVREEIELGNIERANHLLGYHYFVTGEVVHGNHLGGPVLGFPTLNLLAPSEKLLPPNGVYITETVIGDDSIHGITNVGCKPTVAGEYPIGVETHLFDFNQDVYGKTIRVDFLSRVRNEYKFESLDALKSQLQEDIAFGRKFFETY